LREEVEGVSKKNRYRGMVGGRERGRYNGDTRRERKRRKKVGNGEGGIDKVEK
jgi:hypothetical protein